MDLQAKLVLLIFYQGYGFIWMKSSKRLMFGLVVVSLFTTELSEVQALPLLMKFIQFYLLQSYSMVFIASTIKSILHQRLINLTSRVPEFSRS